MSSTATASLSSPKHAWSQATTTASSSLPGASTKIINRDYEDLSPSTSRKSENRDASQESAISEMVSIYEIEEIVRSLRSFPVELVGSDEFLEQYAVQVERLSLQAHADVLICSGDEYVVETILTYKKVDVLVKTLLAVEAWRMNVLSGPVLPALVAENGNTLRVSFTAHVETTLVGLLNIVLYRREGCEGMDGETAVALVDYCARHMVSLSVPLPENEMVRRQKTPLHATAEHIRTRTHLQEIHDTRLDAQYKTAVAATSLARYLCEHLDDLPLCAQTRILDTHDYLIMIVPLINEPPWTRRRKKNGSSEDTFIWEKFTDNQWKEIPSSNLLQITKCEAQPWIALFYLTCNDTCRQRYGLNAFRKEQLLKLRKYLNDFLLDQLPILADVMRYMDELSLVSVPETTSGHGSALLMQQVPILRESLIAGKDWDQLAKEQFQSVFQNVKDSDDPILRKISDIYSQEGIEHVLGEPHKVHLEHSTSQPIRGVSLSVQCGTVDDDILKFELKPLPDSSSVAETPEGIFQRFKMTIVQEEAEMMNPCNTNPIPPKSKVTANVSFEGIAPFVTQLHCSDLNLPGTVPDAEHLSDQESKVKNGSPIPKSLPSMEWRQLGSLKDNIVIQLGFKRMKLGVVVRSRGMDCLCCYTLHQAFLSQPLG